MRKLFVVIAMLSANALMLHAQQLTLQIDKAETEVSPMLYGLMTEEINYSYEGGLYTQLVPNPSFTDMNNPRGRRGCRFLYGNKRCQKWQDILEIDQCRWQFPKVEHQIGWCKESELQG